MATQLIGIDWGSTNFRAFLIDANSQIIAKKQATCGMLSLQPDQFAITLREQLGDWLQQYSQIPIYMAGMVGSRQGWVEADYLYCPIQLNQLSSLLTQVDFDPEHPCYIVPGVAFKHDGDCDVMRGEEIQLLGAMTAGLQHEVFCMPGTHSKWAVIEDGTLDSFRTFMTGELFALLEKHSILSKQLTTNFDDAAFDDGIQHAKCYRGLLADLFKVRANVLLGEHDERSSYSYLSGLLIGYEIMEARNYWESVAEISIKVIAEKTLAKWYLKAFTSFGCSGEAVDPDIVVVNGLRQIQGNKNESK